MQEIAKRIQNRALELLADGTVSRVLGWEKGETQADWTPALFESAEEMKDFVYGEYAGANLSKYCLKLKRLEGRTLVVLKPCDTLSFHQLTKEHRVDREKFYIIGAGYKGMKDEAGTLLKCNACKGKEFVVYDEIIDDEESRIAFTSSLAVFYQGGSWEYAELSRAVEELAVIPIYCGIPGEEQSGLCMDALHHWAVNAQASPEDQAASLDFLYYLVTDRQAIAVMADLFGGICYRSAPIHPNPILAAALEQLAQGCPSVTWAYRLAPNPAQWRRTVVTALTAYAEDPSDKTWAIVTDTIVDGWAYEYRLAGND